MLDTINSFFFQTNDSRNQSEYLYHERENASYFADAFLYYVFPIFSLYRFMNERMHVIIIKNGTCKYNKNTYLQ